MRYLPHERHPESVTVGEAVVRRATSPSPAGRAAALSLAGRAAALSLLLVLFPAGSSFGQAPADPAQNATAGARVFGAKGCAGCHAINGIGGGVGPDLAGTAERNSFYDLASAMWNHLSRMAAVMRGKACPPSPESGTRLRNGSADRRLL